MSLRWPVISRLRELRETSAPAGACVVPDGGGGCEGAAARRAAIVSRVALAGALGLLALAGLIAFQTQRFLAGATRREGEIVAVELGVSVYCPTVRFVPAGRSAPLVVKAGICRRPPTHYPGEQVTVLYDPRHPSEARLESFADLWLTTLLPLAGAAFIMIFRWGVARGTARELGAPS